ncbi:hypothetical protein CAEBREN_05605 [Caenorhabditis brenneri]|uniref:Uncharacterized protein n=1 Tax=Caenorhabditis brenneri TaxID=135651 RepID=G0NE19_CAEBE|nr:hypothetical protein CAEBREN_05605 [Caenorhabditis brenneri]
MWKDEKDSDGITVDFKIPDRTKTY